MGAIVVGAGALGYFGERFMRTTDAHASEGPFASKKSELLYKMPLGNFTMQLIQGKRTLHLVFDIDIYVMGASGFQEINGAVGRARLRDATVAAIAELAQTDMGLEKFKTDDTSKTAIAEKIVRKLYVNFPTVRTGRVNNLFAHISAQE
jgi:hypothetical protein